LQEDTSHWLHFWFCFNVYVDNDLNKGVPAKE